MQTSSSSGVKITRGHSCLSCHQRKVKCDGKRPCLTCIKSGTSSECRSAPKQPKIARSREAASASSYGYLLARLRRYEELLSANGVPVGIMESSVGEDIFMRDSASPAIDGDDGHMIVQHGHTRFVENALWKGLGNEFVDDLPDPSEDEQSRIIEEVPATPDNLVLGRTITQPLRFLHPSVPQLLMLWQTFLNNFDPLVKLFHAPSVQNMIYEAANDLEAISPGKEALLFSIYLSAATTLNDQQCIKIMGQPKTALLTTFSNATQQALVNAEFLKCTDLIILQALTLYLLASRTYFNSQSLWLLAGLANRIGQTMGLHRESSLKRLSPFEAEIRRRLWWQIMIMDRRSAQLSGVAIDAGFNTFWNTKRPLNVSDSDLSPYMKELPRERDGPTEMLFCTIRTEIGEYIRQMQLLEMNSKASYSTSLPPKLRLIDECETKLDQNILNKLDPSIPLHTFAIYLTKSAMCQLKLSARHPQKYADKGASLAREEKDDLFRLALEVIGYDSITYSMKSLQGFLWHVTMHFPFEAFIFILTELLTRVNGEEVDRAWLRVNQAFEDHPEFIDEATQNQLYFALGNITIKAWDKRMLAAQENPQLSNRPVMTCAIHKLQAQRTSKQLSKIEPGLLPQQPEPFRLDTQSFPTDRPTSSVMQSDRSGFIDWSSSEGQQQGALALTDGQDTISWDYWTNLLQGPSD